MCLYWARISPSSNRAQTILFAQFPRIKQISIIILDIHSHVNPKKLLFLSDV